MDIKTISEDNINEYSDYVDCDVAEKMSCLYYRGIAGYDPDDDNLLSLLIWELKSAESSKDTESELKWIYAVDPSFIPSIMDGYQKEALSEDIKKSSFELSHLDSEKEECLGKCGFSHEAVESRNISVTLGECQKLAFAHKEAPSFVKSISLLADKEFYQGIMNILFRYKNPALEDLSYLPKKWYEQSISCYTKTDDKVTGLLLVHACPSGVLVPVLLFAVGPDSKINLVEMMRFSISHDAKKYPSDTVIRIYRRNPEVKALSKKLVPDKKGEPAIAGERIEKG